VVVAALVLGSCSLGGSSGYKLSADFEQGIGLYPGSPVRVLGIDVGKITEVKNQGRHVRVQMHIDEGTKLPADVKAAVVPVSLLGERYIQFAPVFTGGPSIEAGSLIPLSRTQVPVEIDELLRGLKDFFGGIEPENARRFVTNLATIIQGQGEKLNSLIGNAAGTLNLLADKGGELGGLVDSLAQLTTTLNSRTEKIKQLVRDYDTVAGVLESNKGALDDTITQLTRVATELADLLTRHREPLKEDIGTLTTVTRTLDRNLGSLDLTLASTVRLFSAAARAYDAERNMLPLNNQGAPEVLTEVASFRLRDRLAGVCRRLLTRIGPSAPPELTTCGDPASGFFDPILGVLPGILGQGGIEPGGASGTAASKAVLDRLPPLTPEQQAKLDRPPPVVARPAPSSLLEPLLPPAPPRKAAAGSSGGLLQRLVHGFLGAFS
jgi:phospholipid/cholesterol/gamma-HCH transport system substrate-binding protein